jgi:hypothetical protein
VYSIVFIGVGVRSKGDSFDAVWQQQGIHLAVRFSHGWGTSSRPCFQTDSGRQVGSDEKRIDQLKIETVSRKLPRSVLRGKLNPGNAWDEYNLALDDAVPWDDDPNGALLARFLNGDARVDRAKVNRLIADHQQAIDHLRLGAQRSDGQYPYNWERGMTMALPSLMRIRRLANLAVAQAKVSAENGRPRDAAEPSPRRVRIRERRLDQRTLTLQLDRDSRCIR